MLVPGKYLKFNVCLEFFPDQLYVLGNNVRKASGSHPFGILYRITVWGSVFPSFVLS